MPDDCPSLAINFIGCVDIPCRDEVVPFAVFVDRVDVEVVPGIRRVVTGPRLGWIEGNIGLRWINMIKTAPFE